ncbi:hypothetical protein FBF32_00800 [Candidatus Saccharibacteria bacterium oral taxon 488]|nr:hypothetical protein FBF32_00800 [Candidatus Saccharibacteria bacterium oral taxon 488]
MPQNPNRLPTSSPESLGPEAATPSSYSPDSDDRFKGKLNAGDLDAEALFDPARRKQLEEAQLARDAWQDYLNQRPDEYGKDPNGNNILSSEEDLYDQTLNEARREREATSLIDLATAAGEALARGDKTMADDLQDEILQRLIDRAETYDLSQEAIDQRIRQLTKIMDNAENVAKEKATKAATQRTLSFPATPQASESAPATESEPTQTVPTAPVRPVQGPEGASGSEGEGSGKKELMNEAVGFMRDAQAVISNPNIDPVSKAALMREVRQLMKGLNDALDSSATDPLKAGGRPAPATSESGGGQGGPESAGEPSEEEQRIKMLKDHRGRLEARRRALQKEYDDLKDKKSEKGRRLLHRIGIVDGMIDKINKQLDIFGGGASGGPDNSEQSRRSSAVKPEVSLNDSARENRLTTVAEVKKLREAYEQEYEKHKEFLNSYEEDASKYDLISWFSKVRDVITALEEAEEKLDKPSLSEQVRKFHLSKEKKLLDEFAWWQNNKPPRLTVDRDGEAAKLDPGREGDDPKQKQQGSDLELKNGSEKKGAASIRKIFGWGAIRYGINEPYNNELSNK